MTELGSRLKEARESKGISLDELQSITKIQKRYLIGIEEGNYSMMPGKFYVRAFIKQYAEAVGLDPDEIFEEYKNEIPSTYDDDLPGQLSRVQSRTAMSHKASKALDLLPKVLLGLVLVGLGVLIWYLVVQSAGDSDQQPDGQDKKPVVIEEPEDAGKDGGEGADEGKGEDGQDGASGEEGTEEEAPEAEQPKQELTLSETSGKQSTFELKNAQQFELTVSSKGETWVEVRNSGGKKFFGGMLTATGETSSQTFDLANETEVTVRVGRVPDTEILVNGEKLEFASDQITQNITIKYVKSEE